MAFDENTKSKYVPYRQLPLLTQEQKQNMQSIEKPFHWSQVTENGEIGVKIAEIY